MVERDWLSPGSPVWYYPVIGADQRHAAVVGEEPRDLGGIQVVRIVGLGLDYQRACATTRTTQPAVRLEALRPRSAEHEKLRQLAIWCDDAMAELEANGATYGVTREQVRAGAYAVLNMWNDE